MHQEAPTPYPMARLTPNSFGPQPPVAATMCASLLATDAVVEAIDDVSSAVQDNVHDEEDLLAELARVRRDRVAGVPLQAALGGSGRPRVLGLLGGIVDRVTLASARLRHALVTALVGEGESVTSIATRFEVTHQRISSILRRGRT
jgi:hypothetical protein